MEINSSKSIISYIENGIQRVILNRPLKKNAITAQMYQDLIRLLNDSAKNDTVLMFAMTGNGDFYSSGNDFLSFLSNTNNEDSNLETELNYYKCFVDSLIKYPKLLVAIVNGPAIGIAATTLALYDIVYASDKTYITAPFSKLGLVAEGCSSFTFPKILGPSKASEILYFGEKLTALEAEKFGLVSKVYKSGSEKEIWKYLEKISLFSKESLMATKRLTKRWHENTLLQVNEEESKELKKLLKSPEFIENISKFMFKKSKI